MYRKLSSAGPGADHVISKGKDYLSFPYKVELIFRVRSFNICVGDKSPTSILHHLYSLAVIDWNLCFASLHCGILFLSCTGVLCKILWQHLFPQHTSFYLQGL